MPDLAPMTDDQEREEAFSSLMTGFTAGSDFEKRLLLGVYKSAESAEKGATKQGPGGKGKRTHGDYAQTANLDSSQRARLGVDTDIEGNHRMAAEVVDYDDDTLD